MGLTISTYIKDVGNLLSAKDLPGLIYPQCECAQSNELLLRGRPGPVF